MNKTITVKGIGKATAAPDCVVIYMTLKSRNLNYQLAMEEAANNIDSITSNLIAVGFDKKDIKTTDFDVRTLYESRKKKDGHYQSEFVGYEVDHDLQLRFDFDSKTLSNTLAAIASCVANPNFRIAFTVKDKTAINDEMLRSATINARRKAEVLCEASGAKLGELIAIDYNWGEISIYSNTHYSMDEDCMCMTAQLPAIEIEPEEISVSDTATFIWAISDQF